MEIRIYNSEMMFLGLIEDYRSLLWNRKYFECGNFELHAPITKNNAYLLKPGNLLWLPGHKEAGVVEDITLSDSSREYEITVKGRFLASYMDRRILKNTFIFDGKTELAMRNLYSSCIAIPRVVLSNIKGFTSTISFQATYKNLLSLESKLAKSAGLGFRFVPDFMNKTITFEIYEGENKSLTQSQRSRVVFSDSYNNLSEANYIYNNQTYRTCALVGGEGEGSERVTVTVGKGEGLELREIFVDARDIRREENMSLTDYQQLLIQRGIETLAKNTIAESIECDIEPRGNFAYPSSYDLGDIVTIHKEDWGIQRDLRVTEIQEVYEHEIMTIIPTFGNPLPDKIDWSNDY